MLPNRPCPCKEKDTQNIEVVQKKVDDGNNFQKPETEKEKDVLPDGSQDGAKGQSLTEPNFLEQMQTLINSGATEEESLDRIKRLKSILDLMENKHQGYAPMEVNKRLAVNIPKQQEESVPKENIEWDINKSNDYVVIPAISNMVVEVKGSEPTPKTLPEVQNPMENVDELEKPAACSNPSDMQKEMDMILQSVIYEP